MVFLLREIITVMRIRVCGIQKFTKDYLLMVVKLGIST